MVAPYSRRAWLCASILASTLSLYSRTAVAHEAHTQCIQEIHETKLAPQEAEAAVNELLQACFNDEKDPRPFAEFIELIIKHLEAHKQYFIDKYPTIEIDKLIQALRGIQKSKSANMIGLALKDYKSLLPENLQNLTILAMRKRIAARLKF